MADEPLNIPEIFEDIKGRIDPLYAKTIACEEGWHKLVAECHLEILKIDPNYKIYQIKEKFGSLRYYFDTKLGDMVEYEIFQVASKYELLSQEVCEKTGKPGVLMFKQGLYKTLAGEFENDGWLPQRRITYEKIFGKEQEVTEVSDDRTSPRTTS